MGPAEVREFCELDEPSQGLIDPTMRLLRAGTWGYHCVHKLCPLIPRQSYGTLSA